MAKMITMGLASIFAGFVLLAINQLAYAQETQTAPPPIDLIAP
tara:strand:- start:3679 stop:3807 length:129 start_codon:yes stop_codon:yes gene_type:complete